jgi:hypothetical protein
MFSLVRSRRNGQSVAGDAGMRGIHPVCRR